MPVSNDLTPEEEREFIEHGLQPAGPGKEPLAEENVQQGGGQQQDDGGQQQDDGGQQQQQDQRPRDPTTGRFLSREEIAAQQQQQGQQDDGGQQQDDGGQQQQQDQRTVPLQALHAERQRTAQLAQRAQLAEARMNAMLTAQQGRGQQREQLPNLDDDPVGYIQGLEARLAQFEQSQQEERQYRQIDNAIESDENLFKQSQPDYDAASDHYVRTRASELLTFYPPDEAQRLMIAEARTIAQQAWQRGMSPAQVIYTLAQARGYQRQQDGGQQQQQGNGQGQQQGGGMERVAATKRAQGASRSLSGGGSGGGSAQSLNAEALLNMSDEEFEKYIGIGKKGADARFAAIG